MKAKTKIYCKKTDGMKNSLLVGRKANRKIARRVAKSELNFFEKSFRRLKTMGFFVKLKFYKS